MNDAEPGTAGPTTERGRVRSVADMRRSSSDRLIAGVCGGAGRHLGIDPVIIRVVLAVLVLAGFAGLILYVGLWLLIPSDDAPRSLVAEWFDIGPSEPQVRTTGLLVAGILALMAVIGDTGLGFLYWPVVALVVWVGIPLAAAYWFFVVRPRKAGSRTPTTTQPTQAPPGVPSQEHPMSSPPPPGAWAAATDAPEAPAGQWPPPPDDPLASPGPQPPPRERPPFSWALTVLTLSVTAIALAVLFLATGSDGSVRWTTYAALALGVTAAGLLVGTLVGNAGPLIPVGVVLVAALVVGLLVPSLRTGDPRWEPAGVAQLQPEYTLGMGRLTLDLGQIDDPQSLEGRTVRLNHGMGETIVAVPADVEVELDATLLAGGIDFLGERWNGTGLDVDHRTSPTGPALTLDVDQSMGQVTVVRR